MCENLTVRLEAGCYQGFEATQAGLTRSKPSFNIRNAARALEFSAGQVQ